MSEDKKASFEDQAANTFNNLFPIWKRLISGLTSKAKDRVMIAIAAWPLEEVPKFQSGKEMEAFKLGCTLFDCKTVMISAVFEERIKKEKQTSQIDNGLTLKTD